MGQLVILGELYSTKNSRQIYKAGNGRTFVTKSLKSKEQEMSFALQLNNPVNREIWSRMVSGKQLPIKLAFKIFRRTKSRFDYLNIVQGLTDAMTKAGYIPDDDSRSMIPVFEQAEVDKYMPRTELSVL